MDSIEQQDNKLRDSLYRAVYEEFVGPLDFEVDEELRLRPTERYSAGVLHPIGSEFAEFGDQADEGGARDDGAERIQQKDGTSQDIPDGRESGAPIEDGDLDEPISLSNARSQSAISMTIAVRESDRVSFSARAATYEKRGIGNERVYIRHPVSYVLGVDKVSVPRRPGPPIRYKLDKRGLELWVVFRRHIDSADVITVALCNTLRDSDKPTDCYYQTSLKVTSLLGLVPPVWKGRDFEALDEEPAMN